MPPLEIIRRSGVPRRLALTPPSYGAVLMLRDFETIGRSWPGLSPLRARAGECSGPAQATERVESLPPPGTCRLIRIGPQVLVSEDDRGRFTMVDEPEEKPGRGRRVINVVMGLLTAGAVLNVGRNDAIGSGYGGRPSRR